MKSKFLLLVSLSCLYYCVSAQVKYTDKGIFDKFVTSGYYVMDTVTLTHGYVLLVTERLENKKSQCHYALSLLMLRDSAGHYKEEGCFITAENASDCPSDGFDKITVDGDSFTIEENLCGGWYFIHSCITLEYDTLKSGYVLSGYSKEYSDRRNPESSRQVNYSIKDTVLFKNITQDLLEKLLENDKTK